MTAKPVPEHISDERVTLAECPIGLFINEHGGLCLKTEYGNNEGRIDAYIVSSGEFFWGAGPATIATQRAQLVTPVPETLLTELQHRREAEAGTDVVADWSALPRDLYVIEARRHDIGFDVTLCSVPMVTAPEVRYVRSDMLAVSPSSPASGVRVTPLQWEQLTSRREDGPPEPIAEWEATCLAGIYSISDEGMEWVLSLATIMDVIPNLGRSGDPDALRAVAQSDFAGRILSALGEHP